MYMKSHLKKGGKFRLALMQRWTLAGKSCIDLATLLDLLEKKNLRLDLDTEEGPEMTFCSHSK
jgi:hypothetical protein